MDPVRLNVGCGPRKLPGFINIDIDEGADLRLDVTDGLPFEDCSVDAIVSEHFIEHLSFPEAIAFLRECRRVLRWDGVVRIATPDLDLAVQRYLGDWKNQHWMHQFGYTWIQTPAEMLNIFMRYWGHQWIYNQEELVRIAQYAGLTFRARCNVGESDAPELRGLEYREDSLILEFVKRRPQVGNEPLVSVVIPAYNERYFEEALQSALSQTYNNIEVIVTDDAPGPEIARIVERYAHDSRIRYFKNEPRIGASKAYRIYMRPLEFARGEYIKFLNDDDLLAPVAVEKMVDVLQNHPEVSLVTSHRQRIDEKGNALEDDGATRRPVRESSIIRGSYAVHRMLATKTNYIGEPSTTMFRRCQLEALGPQPFLLAGVEISWNVDVTLWMNLLSQGDLCYLTETLSCFRQHGEQQQRRADHIQRGIAAWNIQCEQGSRLGFFSKSAMKPGVRVLELPEYSLLPFPDIAGSGERRFLLPIDPADASKEWLDVVSEYLRLTTPAQGISLILWIDPLSERAVETVVSQLNLCAARAGVDLSARTDLILEARAFGRSERMRLFRSVTEYISIPGGDHWQRRLDEARASDVPILSKAGMIQILMSLSTHRGS